MHTAQLCSLARTATEANAKESVSEAKTKDREPKPQSQHKDTVKCLDARES